MLVLIEIAAKVSVNNVFAGNCWLLYKLSYTVIFASSWLAYSSNGSVNTLRTDFCIDITEDAE